MKHWPKALLATLLLASPASAAPTVTEFPIPTAAALPQDIVLGPATTGFASAAAST